MQIAAVIHELPGYQDAVAEHFANTFGAEDPSFDRPRFMAAAIWGIEERRGHGEDLKPSRQHHIDAAARHEHAAENHEHTAKFWDDNGDRERAELHRALAEYERRGAELERGWAELAARGPA